MDGEYITRNEFGEFERRISVENERVRDEDNRQNKRIEALEKTVEKLHDLTISVEKMAQSTQQMAEELSRQGLRLDALETAPSKRWNTAMTAALGIVLGGLGTTLLATLIQSL